MKKVFISTLLLFFAMITYCQQHKPLAKPDSLQAWGVIKDINLQKEIIIVKNIKDGQLYTFKIIPGFAGKGDLPKTINQNVYFLGNLIKKAAGAVKTFANSSAGKYTLSLDQNSQVLIAEN